MNGQSPGATGEGITPRPRGMRLPLTSTAPSCRGVSGGKQVSSRSTESRASELDARGSEKILRTQITAEIQKDQGKPRRVLGKASGLLQSQAATETGERGISALAAEVTTQPASASSFHQARSSPCQRMARARLQPETHAVRGRYTGG